MGKKRRRFFILIIISIILFVGSPKTIDYFKSRINLDKETFVSLKDIEVPHSSQIVYKKFDNGIIKYWEGILIYYNIRGEQKWTSNLSINRPVIRTNSNNIYIVDEGKNQLIRLNKRGDQVYKIRLERNYENFNICDNNYVVLHNQKEGLVEYVSILDDEGKKLSEIALGEGHITNIAISKQDNKVAISTIGTRGDRLDNKILTYDLNGKLIGSESFGDNIILNMFFSEKGDLIVADETDIFSINREGKINWKTDFQDLIRILDMDNRNFIGLYSQGGNRRGVAYSSMENTIKILAYNGKLLGEIRPNTDLIDIDSYKNNIIGYSARSIYKYSRDGDLKGEYPFTSDIVKSFILSDKNIVVISKEKISFLSLKGR